LSIRVEMCFSLAFFCKNLSEVTLHCRGWYAVAFIARA